MNCNKTDGKIKMNCNHTELEINTSNCTNTDAYAYGISIDIGWFNEWIVWEGGIAFNTVYWLLILLISFIILYLLRWKLNCRLLTERLDGLEDPPPPVKRASHWVHLLNFSIDEEAIGKDGSTFLWFQYRLIQIEFLRMALGIVLIIMHFHSDQLGEWPNKTLRSTGLYNSGVNGTHGVICSAILTVLAWLMKKHGQHRCIRSLASHDVNSNSSICNRKWLMITGLPLTTTVDSLLEYLMCTFESSFSVKGIHREQIVMAHGLSKLLPVVDRLDFIRNVKLQINGKANKGKIIQRRFWDFKSYFKKIDALSYYNKMEEMLTIEKDKIINTLEFTGTVFIRFDSPSEAKAVKIAIRRYQSNLFWKREQLMNNQLQPSRWTVRYAPPGSDLSWIHMKKPRPIWKTMAVWLRLAVSYSIYVFVMAAPASIVRWLHLEGHGLDHGSVFWKRFVLPTMVSFFTTTLTNWVTQQDQHRRHLTVTKASLASFRSICFLEIILYLVRMMARKPLPLLLAGDFNSDDFRLECLFFPVHGSFVACCIIVNTISGILLNHLRFDFLWSYTKKWFTFRSEEEKNVYITSYRAEYNFASNYAELVSNFALTSIFIMIFPVISLVSCVFSILRFISDRAALTQIYPVSQIGHNLHRESINMVLRFGIASPLTLLIYRRIQLGPSRNLLDPGIVAPLCLTILYLTYLVYAHFKSRGALPKWFRRLLRLRPRNARSNEQDVIDSMSNIQNEYDPVAQIREDAYVKKDVLGVGSFSIVFRGSHRGLDVAVKRIELHRLDPDDREAKLQMKLEHENVLKIFAVEKDDDYRYIILELCVGTLDQVYEKGKVYEGPALPPDQTVMYQIANGLDYIHSKKLIHRDVKPENILISKTGEMKLSDFGLCKQICPRETFSMSGFKGTASWIAPELLKAVDNEGQIQIKGTTSSDIFSAGCVFFVFVTRGTHPFGDDHIAVQINIRNNQQVNIDKLDSDHFTSSVIRKMIEPEPSRRMPLTQVKELFKAIPRRLRGLGSLGSFNEVENRNTTSNKEGIPHTPPARRRTKSIQSERRKQLHHKFHGIHLSSSPTTDAGQFFPMAKGATLGVPLENCPRSTKHENIPKIVEVCISIIEEHGMDSVGVYRVPGNVLVVNDISDSLNKGDFDQLHPRGNEVNIISSVIKSFFRKLPDPLVTSEFYSSLIEASKMEPEEFRLTAIKQLVEELPDPHYSTLRYLIVHLSRVARMSSVNKMDARNLATVFGPTLVRPGDDSMATMMADMPYQCRIVEMLIDKVDFFFPPSSNDAV